MKVAIIGAGNVGSMVASRVTDAGLADVVLVDIVPGLAKGKALDISDARPIFNSNTKITGTEDFDDIQDAKIVVITAGLPRKPGMSRDDLLKKNAQILKDISSRIKNLCPSAIIIVVTNPLDVMTYVVMKTTGFNPRKVIGMAGVLDSARFINIVSEKVGPIEYDKVYIIGNHGDMMVAIDRTKGLPKDICKECFEQVKHRGAEIVSYLRTGSAYFAPSASVFYMLKAILGNEQRRICASAYLQGEYGERDIYIGVPVILDSSGVKEVVEIELTDEEKQSFSNSVRVIREAISKL